MESLKLAYVKAELGTKSPRQLIDLCIRLTKFKNENKELISYLLGYENRENDFVQDCKSDMTAMFEEVNKESVYHAKKTIRKILRTINRYGRISGQAETQVQLLISFCQSMNQLQVDVSSSQVLINIYFVQLSKVRKLLGKLHEDLQYDYLQILDELAMMYEA